MTTARRTIVRFLNGITDHLERRAANPRRGFFGRFNPYFESALIASMLADLTTFLIAAEHLDISGELSPIYVWLYSSFGAWGVIPVKLLAIGGTVLLSRGEKWGRAWGWASLTIATLGIHTNTLALAISR